MVYLGFPRICGAKAALYPASLACLARGAVAWAGEGMGNG